MNLGLAVRAGLPQVYTGHYGAVVVDGAAPPNAILARYADGGPAAVLGADPATGAEPYALVLADPERGVLVLARRGDGPCLYYARHGNEVLVASEPVALLDGGLPMEPDPDIIRGFLDTGDCDTGIRTFLRGIRRVLPDQVLELSATGITTHPSVGGPAATYPSTALALHDAARAGHVGVRLDDTLGGLALLGVVLAGQDADTRHATVRPAVPSGGSALPSFLSVTGPPLVYTTGPAGAADAGTPRDPYPYLTAVLDTLLTGSVTHKAVPVEARDLDEFLIGLGEPVPDAAALLAWCTARESAGEVDTVLDPAGAEALLCGSTPPGYLPRLADRVATRFGVALRMPYRQAPVDGGTLRGDLVELCRRGLPPDAVRCCNRRTPADGARTLLRTLRPEVYATFLSGSFGRRPWHDARAVVRGFGDVLAGRGRDADRYWRAFVLERWLRLLEARGTRTALARPPAIADGHRETSLEGERWVRLPVRTRTLRSGDEFAETLAWYVTELVGPLCAVADGRQRFRHRWYLAVRARPLAVTQGRVRPLWEVRPGWWAHRLSGYVRDGSWRNLGNPWTMQLAIEEVGLRRMLLAAAAGAVGRLFRRPGVFHRVAGDPARDVCGPNELSGYPTNVAVAAAPRDTQRAVDAVAAAVRAALPEDVAAGLAGCAILSGGRLGEARRVLAVSGDAPASFFAAAVADDPLDGQLPNTPATIIAPAVSVSV
ncbi:MAG: hypothetical protein WCA46_14960 [Actinocatenispora sp.]